MGFPKYVFKRGTGKQAHPSAPFIAEGVVVDSEAALAALGPGWCESPQDAAEPAEGPVPVKPAKKAK